jgi:tRNA threonylcarbamoyladenosine biosynthesis protein TsaB
LTKKTSSTRNNLILCIETATSVCSVALAEEGRLLAYRENSGNNSHSSDLTGFIEEVFAKIQRNITELAAVAVSTGPGSYTGLRIGVSSAKGLAYALNIPLIGIETLHSMAYGARDEVGSGEKVLYYCPMIDARRMEVYAAVFDINMFMVREVEAEIIDRQSFSGFLKAGTVLFFGNGAEKCKHLLFSHSNAVFQERIGASARYMCSLTWEKFKKKAFEDIAAFEPSYLKDFIAGKPKVKGLYE